VRELEHRGIYPSSHANIFSLELAAPEAIDGKDAVKNVRALNPLCHRGLSGSRIIPTPKLIAASPRKNERLRASQRGDAIAIASQPSRDIVLTASCNSPISKTGGSS